jgi:hypothetical protein
LEAFDVGVGAHLTVGFMHDLVVLALGLIFLKRRGAFGTDPSFQV